MGQAALKESNRQAVVETTKDMPLREAAAAAWIVRNTVETERLQREITKMFSRNSAPLDPNKNGGARVQVDDLVFVGYTADGGSYRIGVEVACPACRGKHHDIPYYQVTNLDELGRMLLNASIDPFCSACVTHREKAAREEYDWSQ